MGPVALILSEILYKICLWEEYCGKNIMGRIMDFFGRILWEELLTFENVGRILWEEFLGRISWEE